MLCSYLSMCFGVAGRRPARTEAPEARGSIAKTAKEGVNPASGRVYTTEHYILIWFTDYLLSPGGDVLCKHD